MKGSRFITHLKRLVDVEQPLANVLASGGGRGGPAAASRAGVRSPSFDDPRLYEQLAERGVACVWADTAGRWPQVERDTADFRYVRLHGDSQLYTSGYGDAALDRWAEKLRSWAGTQDVHCYFDNDAHGHAPHDALRLRARLTD